ncbi:MAG: hypothetical protein ACRERE_42240 [Candidatus Entotheonellia bacterium]
MNLVQIVAKGGLYSCPTLAGLQEARLSHHSKVDHTAAMRVF